ncbi:DUF2169 family type VI secretion system accessory protein [Polyangium aurulentum]|uniref:DUF2169 family type VI secretion system accessory protein n=1 Tax=Polyangium aurulentum TaxID=2567896 RepID=UPI0010AECEFD|nr:DUF2169 domain-containing protein [Polyangium aurulentum]UQA58339.1 DUF2169 domain-containing protein [Polyangium aurulentum]
MRTLKPSPLSLLNGPFEADGKVYLVFAIAVMLDCARVAVEQEQTLWQIFPKAPGSNGMLDEMRPKVRGEWLVLGSAHAPGKKPASAVAVRAGVGAAQKELWAVGDRVWKGGVPSEAEPFVEMPLAWERAFGGEGFAQNPLGKGFKPVRGDAGEVHALPNVELAGKLVTSPRERPAPAGFGPIDPSWPSRASRAGTYDKRWLDTRYPGFPEDFDPTHFNMAPEDQWIEGASFPPGERFWFENMHPDKPRVEGTLPPVRARLFVTRRDEEAMREVPLRCDTLWFLPHVEKVIALFRGTIEVEDELAEDLVDVLAALEWTDRPKPLSHYTKVREDRLDKKLGPLHSLRDADLMPEDMPILRSEVVNELDELLAKEGLIRKNMERQVEKKLAAMREELVAEGIDPDKHLPPLPPDPPPPAQGDMAAYALALEKQAEELTELGQKKLAQILEEVEAECRAGGLDFAAIQQKARREAGGPPKFSAEAELERLRDMATLSENAGLPIPEVEDKLSDPRLIEKLRAAEQGMKDMYRRGAHLMPPAHAKEGEEGARLRAAVLEALDAKASLAGWDLTGADLSGIDFGGRDLEGAFLEGANLARSSFRGTNAERAVFTRAQLADADLEGARLAGTNLGEADLKAARLVGADLTGAVLFKANLADADLTGARLDGAELTEAVFDRTVLAGVKAKDTMVAKANLSGMDLRGAELEQCTFLESNLERADFTGAKLTATAFIDVAGAGAKFEGAIMKNVRAARIEGGTSFTRGHFDGADLSTANLRGADLSGASFKGAILNGADLSQCKLAGANLEGARAVEARLIKADLTDADLSRTDLMNAMLTRAIVKGARFEEANLFRADAAGTKGDKRTSFRGANVTQVRFVRGQESRG